MKRAAIVSLLAAAGIAASGSAVAHADPIVPGCLDPSQYSWYNPCSGLAPWNSPQWSGADGVPGMYGPHGYTPRDDAQPSS